MTMLDEYDSLLPKDLNLGEYSICNKVAFDLNNYILGFESYINNQYPAMKEIEWEKANYTPTTYPEEPTLFDDLLDFLATHADDYTLEFGEGMILSPTFVYTVKEKFKNNEFLSNQQWFINMMELDAAPSIDKRPYLSNTFISSLQQNLLQGVIEKLAYNFQGSEFVVGFNLSILEYNNKVLDTVGTVENIRQMAQYLYENCPYCEKTVTKKMKYFNRILTNNNRFTEDGKINYTEWVFKNLDEDQINKINKVKRITNIILNNSVAAIKTRLNIENMPLNHIAFPNSSVTEDIE